MGRQLLTNLTSSSSSSSPANGTSDLPCTDFCDPSCGDFDECYTFPAIPDDPLPPSLPPSPTTIVATPSSSDDDSAFHLSPIAIVVIAVLAAAFLFISYYAILFKYFSLFTSFFTRRHPNRISGPDSPPDADADLISPNHHDHHHPFVDHPIWLISTVGLHQSIINSITVIPYKKEDGLIDGTDCSVCLSEFQQGETLRLLPKCKHAFHIDCIDTWLRSHTNCPMCRAAIVLASGRPSTDPSFGHSRRAELTILPDSDSSDIESGIIHPRPRPPGTISISSSNSSINHNHNHNHSHSHNFGMIVGENRGAGTGHVEASGNNNNNNNNENHQENKGNDEYIAILVRRSYSMDCQNGGVQPCNSNSSSSALMATSSSRSLPSRVTLLKRSYSWSERVFSNKDRNSVMSP